MMKFTKMQAFGNDYVYIDAIHQELKNLPELARFVSDRHFAIGSDGMVLICPSDKGDFRMRMQGAMVIFVANIKRILKLS